MEEDQPAHEWIEKSLQLGRLANIDKMQWEDWQILRFIEGTTADKKLREKLIEIENPTIEKIQARVLKYVKDEKIGESRQECYR